MAAAAPSAVAMTPAERPSPVIVQVAEHTELAYKAAGSIVRADVTELKTLKAAPKGVLELLRVALQLGSAEPCAAVEWADVKKECADAKFAQRLKEFNPMTVTEENHAAVAALVVDPKMKVAFAVKVHKWLSEINLAALREAVVEVDPAQSLGMKLTKSCSVFFVTPGGQFDQAGIRRGDKIVGMGSIRVSASEEFAATLKLYKAAGGPVKIVFKEPQARKTAATGSARPSGKLGGLDANEPASAAPKEPKHHFLRRTRPPPPPKGVAAERASPLVGASPTLGPQRKTARAVGADESDGADDDAVVVTLNSTKPDGVLGLTI